MDIISGFSMQSPSRNLVAIAPGQSVTTSNQSRASAFDIFRTPALDAQYDDQSA